MEKPKVSDRNAALILALAVVLGLRAFSLRLGFYHDDWFFLERLDNAGGLWNAIRQFMKAGMWNRPVEIVQIPLTFWLAGQHMLVGQALLGALAFAEAWLLFLLIKRLTRSPGAALLAGVLILLHPSRFVVHVWLSISPLWFAHLFLLLSLLAHLDWIEGRGRRWLAASQVAYLAGVLTYESPAFLPLLLAGARLAAEGRISKRRWLAESRLLAPYLVTLCLALAWQRLGIQWFFDMENPKSLGLSPLHFLRVYAVGFECLTNRVVHAAATSLGRALHVWPLGLKLAWIACAAALYALLRPVTRPETPSSPRVLLGAGVAAYLASYLPFALSGDYTPQFYGIMGRTNGSGAWAGGLCAASGVLWASRRGRAGRALLAVLLGGFLWTDWQFARDWADSWKLQRRILIRCASKVVALPGPVAVLLTGAPTGYGTAVVFDAFWDFDSALKLATARKDMKGNVVTHRLQFEPDKVVERAGGQSMWEHPYRGLYVYDAGKDELRRQEGPSLSRPLETSSRPTPSSKGSSGSGAKSKR